MFAKARAVDQLLRIENGDLVDCRLALELEVRRHYFDRLLDLSRLGCDPLALGFGRRRQRGDMGCLALDDFSSSSGTCFFIAAAAAAGAAKASTMPFRVARMNRLARSGEFCSVASDAITPLE